MAPKHPCFLGGKLIATEIPLYSYTSNQFGFHVKKSSQPFKEKPMGLTREGSTSHQQSSAQILPRRLLGGSSQRVSMVNNYDYDYNVSKSPRPGVVLDPFHSWPKFRAYKWGSGPNYLRVVG